VGNRCPEDLTAWIECLPKPRRGHRNRVGAWSGNQTFSSKIKGGMGARTGEYFQDRAKTLGSIIFALGTHPRACHHPSNSGYRERMMERRLEVQAHSVHRATDRSLDWCRL